MKYVPCTEIVPLVSWRAGELAPSAGFGDGSGNTVSVNRHPDNTVYSMVKVTTAVIFGYILTGFLLGIFLVWERMLLTDGSDGHVWADSELIDTWGQVWHTGTNPHTHTRIHTYTNVYTHTHTHVYTQRKQRADDYWTLQPAYLSHAVKPSTRCAMHIHRLIYALTIPLISSKPIVENKTCSLRGVSRHVQLLVFTSVRSLSHFRLGLTWINEHFLPRVLNITWPSGGVDLSV